MYECSPLHYQAVYAAKAVQTNYWLIHDYGKDDGCTFSQ